MATHAGSLFRDQNSNVHFNGAPLLGKTNVTSAQKKGGLGGRKALIDISNSGKPSTLQAAKKLNSKNVTSYEDDNGISIFSVGGKTNATKALERKQAGGRKALGDLTNSVKPPVQKAPKKSLNKLSAVAEAQVLPDAFAEERFLHNHQECIKAQRNAVDMDYFLKTIGLDNDFSMLSAASTPVPYPSAKPSAKMKSGSPPRYLEMEEMSELLAEDQSSESPCGSPKSPKSYMTSKDYNFTDFILIQTP